MTKEEFKKVRDLVDGSEDLAAEADGTEYMCPSELRALQEEVQSLWWDLADSVSGGTWPTACAPTVTTSRSAVASTL
jgi:hypothetical protein